MQDKPSVWRDKQQCAMYVNCKAILSDHGLLSNTEICFTSFSHRDMFCLVGVNLCMFLQWLIYACHKGLLLLRN